MNRNRGAIIVYGVINIAMGLHGYYGAHSVISLVAGVAIGLIEIALAAWSKTKPSVAYRAAAAVSLLTGLQWFMHLYDKETHQLVIYPAVVGIVLSFGLTLWLLVGHFVATKARQVAAPPAAGVDGGNDQAAHHE